MRISDWSSDVCSSDLRWIDDALMRLTEFFQTIPYFIFALVLVAILLPTMESIIIAIAAVTWPPIARLVRGGFMAMRSREFVEASIVLGMRDMQIIFQQILTNCLSPIDRKCTRLNPSH